LTKENFTPRRQEIVMEPSEELDRLAREAVDCGFHIHREFGPGLLESAYETLLSRALERRGIRVAR
jgi:iron complex transport system substrate-binding protein